MSVTSRHCCGFQPKLCPRPVVGAIESSAVDRPAFLFFVSTLFIFSLTCQRCSFKCTDSTTLDAHEAEFHLCKVSFSFLSCCYQGFICSRFAVGASKSERIWCDTEEAMLGPCKLELQRGTANSVAKSLSTTKY